MGNKPKLECCPFCGGNTHILTYKDDTNEDNWYFACYRCFVCINFAKVSEDLDKSIQAWNKRVSDYDSEK